MAKGKGTAMTMQTTPFVLTCDDGSTAWIIHGTVHRDDGPAYIHISGAQYWCQHGRNHRVDGPAVMYPDGSAEYWIDGERLTIEEFERRKRIMVLA